MQARVCVCAAHRETESRGFLLVSPRSVVVESQRFGGHAASIFRVELLGQGYVNIAILPTHRSS